jgi:MoxR-like ATPase
MNAQKMYALGLDQITNAILVGGHKRTILVQGHMGTGKSSMLNILSQELPKHIPCYLDCTTKDLGDITVPNLAKLDDGTGYVTYLTNEELGAHHDVPVILMIDEYGKANPAVKNALLRLMLERKIGSYTLHPDSIVFATTNLGAEGVGDLLHTLATESQWLRHASRQPRSGSNGVSTTVYTRQCLVGYVRIHK